MPIIRGLLVGFALALGAGALFHASGHVVDTLFIAGTILGAVSVFVERKEQDRRRVYQTAAQQERQARLIADAIAERKVRQELGEYQQ